MLAQKTPPTALTLSFNETWNSLYFQELSIIRIQLFEDYTLRFLILNYLNYRRYWLYKFSVKKTIGMYFLGVKCLSPGPRKRFKILKPIRLRASAIRYGYRRRFQHYFKRCARNPVASTYLSVNNYLASLFHNGKQVKKLANRYQKWLTLKKRIRLFLRHRLWKVTRARTLTPISLKKMRRLKKRFKRIKRRVKLQRRRYRRIYKRYKRKYKRILIFKFRKHSILRPVIRQLRSRFNRRLLKQVKRYKLKKKNFHFILTKKQRGFVQIRQKKKKISYRKAAIMLHGLKLVRQTGLRRYRLHKRLGKKRIKNRKRIKLLKKRCRRLDFTMKRFMRKIYRQRRKFLFNKRRANWNNNKRGPRSFQYRPKTYTVLDDWKVWYKQSLIRAKPKTRSRIFRELWEMQKKSDLAKRAIEREKRAAARREIFRKQEEILKNDVEYQKARARRKQWFRDRDAQIAGEKLAKLAKRAAIEAGVKLPKLPKSPAAPKFTPRSPKVTKRFFSTLPRFKRFKLKQYTFKPKNPLRLTRNINGKSMHIILRNAKQLQVQTKLRPVKYTRALYNPIIKIKIRKYIMYIQVIFKKFFKRKTKTWRIIIYTWIRKWGRKARFRANWRRRLASFIFVKLATERLTKALCFFQFQIRTWKYRTFTKYKYQANLQHVKKALALQLLITTFFAIKKASPLALIDLLRRLLSGRHRHNSQLSAFSAALRFWLVDKTNGQVKANNLCQGVKIEVIGKIDGADRTRTWRYILGRLPSSDFRQNFQYEQSIIATKYGILHLHVWLYFRSYLQHKKLKTQPNKLFLRNRNKHQWHKQINLA